MKISKIKYLLLVCVLCVVSINTQAQTDPEVLDYNNKNMYEIGGINIVGAENRDRNAIKSITGLKEGGKVQIPGPSIPAAIKSLLKLRLFDDVQIIQDSIKGEIVFLKIVLVERPILSRWSYKGVKNSNHDDLNDMIKGILTKGGIVTDDQKELSRQKIRQYYVEKGKLDAAVKVN